MENDLLIRQPDGIAVVQLALRRNSDVIDIRSVCGVLIRNIETSVSAEDNGMQTADSDVIQNLIVDRRCIFADAERVL